jgi:hypothetical protein
MEEDGAKLITTPRQSKVGLAIAVLLLLLSAALLYFAYWGWQLHTTVTTTP